MGMGWCWSWAFGGTRQRVRRHCRELILVLLAVSGFLPQLLFKQRVRVDFNVHVKVDVEVLDDQTSPPPVPIPQLNINNERLFFHHYYEVLDRTYLDCAHRPSGNEFFTISWEEAIKKCIASTQCLAFSRNTLTGWTTICDGGSWKRKPVRPLNE